MICSAAKVSLEVENLDEGNKTALWGYDDVWRIIWMTVIFAALMPLSRSAWALRKNFTLATWLHMVRERWASLHDKSLDRGVKDEPPAN